MAIKQIGSTNGLNLKTYLSVLKLALIPELN